MIVAEFIDHVSGGLVAGGLVTPPEMLMVDPASINIIVPNSA
jgi:hypothetical protein